MSIRALAKTDELPHNLAHNRDRKRYLLLGRATARRHRGGIDARLGAAGRRDFQDATA